MKVGILTLPLRTNYGGILQAYALQTVLERMGHEVVVLDKSPYKHLSLMKMPLSYAKRFVWKYIFNMSVIIFHEKYYNKNYPVISQYIQPFIDKYIHRLEVNNLAELKEKEFDALVVGSDQIWRPSYYPQIANAFFAFAEKWQVKRLAYAASFGQDRWEYTEKQTKFCATLLKKFDLITVREDSGVALCSNFLGARAKHVLDPTMLLTRNDYEYLVHAARISQSAGDMLVYVLDSNPQIEQAIQSMARQKGLIPFHVSSKVENVFAPVECRIQKPVEVWLRGFMDARFVITDSFHACVFSIIFNKPFAVFGNNGRGMSRFSSLLDLFGLEDRLVTSIEEIYQLSSVVNWELVNKKHVALRNICLEILKDYCK